MHMLAHREAERAAWPRHPIVAILDLLCVLVAAAFGSVRPEIALLPAALIGQYAASCAYHWLPYSPVRRSLDHLMIAALITATYVQFWIRGLPENEAGWRTMALCFLMAAVFAAKLALPNHGKLRGALYLALGALGLVFSLTRPNLLPFWGWVGFLAGIALYFAQFLVLNLQKPDPFPGLFGFREIQHVVLLAASGLHLLVAAYCL